VYGFLLVGPSLNIFNWADSHPELINADLLFFLASARAAVGDERTAAMYAAGARHLHDAAPSSVGALSLLYFSSLGTAQDVDSFPLNAVFTDPSKDRSKGHKTHIGFFRSCWRCANSSWIAFKGGENHFDDHGSDSHNNHGHLDVGVFAIESQGQRWAIDLGAGLYDFPEIGYFGRFRFSYYHMSSYGHNTLSFDGESQSRWGSGAIVQHDTNHRWAIVDLTEAYTGAERVQRGVTMCGGEGAEWFVIADEWEHTDASVVTWKMHTVANITSDSATTLLLSQGDVTMRLSVHGINATLHHAPLDLPPPQAPDSLYDGLRVHVISVDLDTSAGGLTVVIAPPEVTPPADVLHKPLKTWSSNAPCQ